MNRTRTLVAVAIIAVGWTSQSTATALVPCDPEDPTTPLLQGLDGALDVISVCDEPDPDPDPPPPPTDEESKPKPKPKAQPRVVTAPPRDVQPVAQEEAPRRAVDRTDAPRVQRDPAIVIDDGEPVATTDRLPWMLAAVALLASGLGVIVGMRLAAGRAAFGARRTVKAAIESLPDGVIVVDDNGSISDANAAAASMLDPDPVGRRLWAALTGVTADGEPLSRWLRDPHDVSSVTANVGRDRIPVALTREPLRPGRSVVVARDLRLQRSIERMQREFLSNVGHELRTPLTSALGFARILEGRQLSPEQRRRSIGAIIQACERLDRVVDLLIDVATLEGRSLASPTDLVQPHELINQVVHRRQQSLTDDRHVFAVDVAAGLPRVMVHADLLRTALDELVDNALKFSPDGGLITISARETEHGDARGIEVRVSDHGVGLSDDEQELIFDDFYQRDGSETRAFGGLGLGLGFVRRVVELHRGRIEVASELGSGSTFSIIVPASTARPATRAGRVVARG